MKEKKENVLDEINHQEKENKINNKEIKEIEGYDSNDLNINQKGNLNMYPDAKEFDKIK